MLSEVLLFLFDPTQHHGLRAECRGMSKDPQLGEQASNHRQDLVLLEAASRIRSHNGWPQDVKYRQPLVVVVTKYDVWSGLLGGKRLKLEDVVRPVSGNHSALYIDALRRRSDAVRTLLNRYASEVITAAEGFAEEVLYVPASALGRGPEVSQALGLCIRPNQVSPMWAEVPMLYSLFRSTKRLVRAAVPTAESRQPATARDEDVPGEDSSASSDPGGSCDSQDSPLASARRTPPKGYGLVSQEILYTSAPRGLRPGSHGFCTVVSTAGMAKNLAERLESLSGYRHQDADESGNVPSSPVNFSHVRLAVGGQKYHVLSRICDAGSDYSGRTNKLAHYIALEPREALASPGGPAWVLSEAGFCVEKWDGEVTTVPPSRKKSRTDDCPAGKCRTWERVAGDAGWAGVLAEAASAKGRPMTVIFKAGMDTLALVREALSLLPPDRRWEVTFSTYFTKLPAGVDCQWRFVLDATPEALALRRNPHAFAIDLCSRLEKPKPNQYLALAQTGIAPQKVESGPIRAAKAQKIVPEQTDMTLPPVQVGRTASCALELEALELDLEGHSPQAAARWWPDRSNDLVLAERRRAFRWNVALAVCLVVLVVGGLIGADYAGSRSSSVAISSDPVTDPTPSPVPVKPPDAAEQVPESKYDPTELLPPEKTENSVPSGPVPPPMDGDAAGESEADSPNPPEDPSQDAAPPESEHKPFDDIEARNGQLAIPPRPTSLLQDARFRELAKLYVADSSQCELKLIGKEAESTDVREVISKKETRDGTTTWSFSAKFPKVITTTEDKLLAKFELKEQSLWFQWAKKPEEAKVNLGSACWKSGSAIKLYAAALARRGKSHRFR